LKRSKIAIGVKTYNTSVARLLQGCLILVLFPQAALPQAKAASAQDSSVNIPANEAGPSSAIPVTSQAAPSQKPTNSLPSTAPTPNRSPALIPRSAETRARIHQAEHRVILNVFVVDASGNPVIGLREEDFTLLDNQRPQKIATFRATTGDTALAPAHVLLMLDSVNNSHGATAYARRELEKFLGQNQGRLAYPVSIVQLTHFGIRAGQSSRDGNALISELKALPNEFHVKMPDQGPIQTPTNMDRRLDPSRAFILRPSTAPLDLTQRYALSIPAVAGLASDQEDIAGRAILIWIGPGWPLLSGPEFLPDTPALKKNVFDYIVVLSTMLRQAQVTVDSVYSPKMLRDEGLHEDYYQAFLNGVATADQASSGNLALPVLAYQSGGQVLEESTDLAADIDKCIADAKSYYVLSFDSAPAVNADEYHSLQVKVNKPGLTVRTNTAYYAQP
jgi:VWFA-related protein